MVEFVGGSVGLPSHLAPPSGSVLKVACVVISSSSTT